MSYRTLEVDLDNGAVRPCGGEALPAKAHALLTIISPVVAASAPSTADSLGELVHDLAGIGHGKHSDLSTNPAHRDDFGR